MMLDEALTTLMARHGAEARRMFGGTCFMVNGNLVIGTHKGGLIVRIGAGAMERAQALGAVPMVMGGRTMKGWVSVEAPEDLTFWVDLAMAFNRSLPPEAARQRSRKA
jgi:TfoX/Sxy family transcriptional regulator of competence genes